MQVISGAPGVGEAHGCPFKTLQADALSAAMSRAGVAPACVLLISQPFQNLSALLSAPLDIVSGASFWGRCFTVCTVDCVF